MTIPTTETEWCTTLLNCRHRGLSRHAIADELGVTIHDVKKRWHLLPPHLRKQIAPSRAAVWHYLDTLDGSVSNTTTQQIAAAVGCALGTVVRYRREWMEKEDLPLNSNRCPDCGFPALPRSPIQSNGKCLLCNLQADGITIPLELAENGELGMMCEGVK